MTWIVNHWDLMLIVLLAIVGLAEYSFNEKRAKEWLLRAVVEAEKELGAKTGALKLRYVYDLFITKFPIFSKVITFEGFSLLVDEVLDEMKHMINTNTAVYNYVNPEE